MTDAQPARDKCHCHPGAAWLYNPTRADSTHLSIVVITAVVLAVVFVLPSGTP